MSDFALSGIASEQWHAWRISRRLLKAFWRVRRTHPELSGIALYAQAIIDLGASVSESPTIVVKHAQASFAAWPANRPVRLVTLRTMSFFRASSIPILILTARVPTYARWWDGLSERLYDSATITIPDKARREMMPLARGLGDAT